MIIKEIPSGLLRDTVEEMWDQHHGWRWDVFAEFLPFSALKTIQVFEVQSNVRLSDFFYWQGTRGGRFSIKSAINIIKNEKYNQADPHWMEVRSVNVRNRINFFLLLVLRDQVMYNKNRVKRNLGDEAMCSLCN